MEMQDLLRQAIRAVFDSWMGERAVEYRRINRLPDDWGTAVNVQQMVFGNKGDDCATGVAFSRDEITGAPEPSGDFLVNAQGEDVAASPGAAKGEIVFTAEDAVAAEESGRDVVLVRPFTEADDVAGFHAAKGILTSEGGKASHAGLLARGMGRPRVAGASALEIDLRKKEIRVDQTTISEGDVIAINGTTGEVTLDDIPLIDPEVDENFETVLAWSDDIRRLGVRANADQPADARKARDLGAEGIGLCRTEHMFMAEDRQPKMRAMIMAEDDKERGRALE